MRLSSVWFLLGEAGRSIRRNGLMSLAAMTSVSIALGVFGGAVYSLYRLHQFAAAQPERFEIAVFLRPETPRKVSQDVAERVRTLSGVKAVRLVPKEEALRDLLQQDTRRGSHVTEALAGANPLPDRLDVQPVSAEQARTVSEALRSRSRFPEIEYVRDEADLVDKLLATSYLVRTVAAVLAILLLLATGIMIHSTLRLTVVARQREIEIMRLVGAPHAFIRLPLVFEGIFYGVVGAWIASGLVFLVISQLSRYVQSFESPLAAGLPPPPGAGAIWAALTLTGLALGTVTSLLSIRRFLT